MSAADSLIGDGLRPSPYAEALARIAALEAELATARHAALTEAHDALAQWPSQRWAADCVLALRDSAKESAR